MPGSIKGAAGCLYNLVNCALGLTLLAIYILGLVWRFNESGKECSEEILEEQGLAIKWYYVLTLAIPCCPCAIAIACCC